MLSQPDYVWGTGAVEQQRLLEQVEFYRPEASWLLDHLGIKAGSRTLDLGCGPLGILDLLSEKVGSTGTVMGIESEARFVETAMRTLTARKAANVQIRVGDATKTELAAHTFDFVHARLLLVVVPDPANIVAEMVRLTKPSGTVAIEDVDVGSWACEPPHPAWGRLFEIFERIYSRDGKDLRIGRRLPGLLRTAGLKDVECNTHVRVNRPGDLHQRQLIMFVKQLWRQIIDLKLINEPELIATFQELECHLARSDTLVVSPLMFQAWGTCPS